MLHLAEINQQFSQLWSQIARYLWPVFIGVLSLWVIHGLNALLGYRLNRFGIWPRHVQGLWGILWAPLLHGDATHLFLNSIPCFVLTLLLLSHGLATFLWVSALVWGLGGAFVWLFAREAIHIGASGVIMGYWGFLLVNAFAHFSLMSLLLAALCLYYFGGLYLSLFPGEKSASWESHVFGFLAGVLAVWL